MQTPDLISLDYVTPNTVSHSSFSFPTYPTSYVGRTEAYSDLKHKPLSSHRRLFISSIVCFCLVNLCTSLALVLTVTISKSKTFSLVDEACELCDLWCTSNCTNLRGGSGKAGPSLTNFTALDLKTGGRLELCCFERQESLAKIYEDVRKETSGAEHPVKPFDGIRVKEKWTKDNQNNWPVSQSVVVFDRKQKIFKVDVSGTYSVHSRFEFSCSNNDKVYEQNLFVNDDYISIFQDHRIQTEQVSSGSTVVKTYNVSYTSSLNVVLDLRKDDRLRFETNPKNISCASPKSIVVFHSTAS